MQLEEESRSKKDLIKMEEISKRECDIFLKKAKFHFELEDWVWLCRIPSLTKRKKRVDCDVHIAIEDSRYKEQTGAWLLSPLS